MSSKFMLIFRGGTPDPSLSPEEMQAYMARWGQWMGGLRSGGHLLAGEPLHAEGRVLTGASKTLTDGPFAETKDIVGGYVLIQVDGVEEATAHARKCPVLVDGGSVEVRETRSV